MARRRGNGWLWALVTLLVIVVALAVGYWYAARFAADKALDRAAVAGFNGTTVGCDDRRLDGFPLRINVGCSPVSVARSGLIGELGGLAAHAALYVPGSVSTELFGPLTLNAPGDGESAG